MQARIKKSIICKEITSYQIYSTRNNTYTPIDGDVALFEVLEIGKHQSIQSETKRIVSIFEGDVIMAAFANRYATSQFEGYVPDRPTEILDILGAGGAIGLVASKNAALEDIEPTKLRLIGFATTTEGQIINTKFLHTARHTFNGYVPNNAKIILSVGSSMDSGKTTSAAFTARGLKTTGKKVAFIKLTGTSFTKDKDFVFDCGADVTVDFTDCGYPSTYMCSKEEILDVYQSLLMQLEPHAPDYIVMEIADGLLERETDFLLRDKAFMQTIHSMIFSCGDSLGVFYGLQLLHSFGIVPAVICGRFTMSPLLIQEVKAKTNIPTLDIDQLANGEYIHVFDKSGMQIVHAA
ncbi:MAG TPA: hypothetical protein PKN40_04255 [Chitinophagales bacterium]|nr:hypothetical protein [Chitinophagales bacterium]HNM28960.1 hypothetical protein [Chitinophagales bacterium]